jgi:hypothetical protein
MKRPPSRQLCCRTHGHALAVRGPAGGRLRPQTATAEPSAWERTLTTAERSAWERGPALLAPAARGAGAHAPVRKKRAASAGGIPIDPVSVRIVFPRLQDVSCVSRHAVIRTSPSVTGSPYDTQALPRPVHPPSAETSMPLCGLAEPAQRFPASLPSSFVPFIITYVPEGRTVGASASEFSFLGPQQQPAQALRIADRIGEPALRHLSEDPLLSVA